MNELDLLFIMLASFAFGFFLGYIAGSVKI